MVAVCLSQSTDDDRSLFVTERELHRISKQQRLEERQKRLEERQIIVVFHQMVASESREPLWQSFIA